MIDGTNSPAYDILASNLSAICIPRQAVLAKELHFPNLTGMAPKRAHEHRRFAKICAA